MRLWSKPISPALIWIRFSVAMLFALQFYLEIPDLLSIAGQESCQPYGLLGSLGVAHLSAPLLKIGAYSAVAMLVVGAIGLFPILNLTAALLFIITISSQSFGCSLGAAYYVSLSAPTAYALLFTIALLHIHVGGWVWQGFRLKSSTNEVLVLFACKIPVILSYFLSGLNKLNAVPFWGNGYTLQHIFLERALYKGSELGWILGSNFFGCLILSWFVMLLEILAPVGLYKKSLEIPLFIAFIIFQIAAYLIMDIRHFENYFYLSFIPLVVQIILFQMRKINAKAFFQDPRPTRETNVGDPLTAASGYDRSRLIGTED